MKKFIVGIDEVGRGALAGPLTVGLVAFQKDSLRFLKGIKDSKKLSPKTREEWRIKIKSQKLKAKTFTSSANNKIIDKLGLAGAIKITIARLLKKAKIQSSSLIYLDGGLKAPNKYRNQKTVVKGDEKIPIIAAASIIAKTERDKKMTKFSKIFPPYGFDANKGYGTKLHREKIKKFGSCPLHRKTFLRNKLNC